MKVFIYGEYENWQKELFFSLLASGIKLEWGRDLPVQRDYEVLIWGVPREEFLCEAPRLKKIIVPYAGIPAKTSRLLQKHENVDLHNLHHNAIPTAEMAFSLLLAAAKSIIPADRQLRKGDWTPRYEGMPSRLLYGKTALILGLGAVGKHLARLLLGMQIKVLAIRRSITEPIEKDGIKIHPASKLDSLLAEAEILAVTLPLTNETDNILNRSRLEKLPRGAVVMNIGRGNLIEEKALYDLLKSGHIAAAGLDVWYNYPKTVESRAATFPGNFPFHELDNVVLSPHRGGAFANYDTEYLRVVHLAKQLNAYKKTGIMPNLVDIKRGY